MSERAGSTGFGPFLLGLAVGAVVGFLFAPQPGEETRAKLTKKLRGLKALAEETAGELADRALGGAGEDDAAEPEAPLSAREELERRLVEARRRRRTGKPARAAAVDVEEEDEPVA